MRCLQAFDNLYYLERAAEVIVKARSMNLELEVISDEVRLHWISLFDLGSMGQIPKV